MPTVKVVELTTTDMPTGDHVWLEVEFSSGQTLNLRIDQRAPYDPNRNVIHVAVNDGIGKELLV